MACLVARPLEHAGLARQSSHSPRPSSSRTKPGCNAKCREPTRFSARRMTAIDTRRPSSAPGTPCSGTAAENARNTQQGSFLQSLSEHRRMGHRTEWKGHSKAAESAVQSCHGRTPSSLGDDQGPPEPPSWEIVDQRLGAWLSDLALLRLALPADWRSMPSQKGGEILRHLTTASLVLTLALSPGHSLAASADGSPILDTAPSGLNVDPLRPLVQLDVGPLDRIQDLEQTAEQAQGGLDVVPTESQTTFPFASNQISTVSFIFGGPSTETTSAGLVLPRDYAANAREVASRLRESLEAEGGGRDANFRDKAEAAKGAIRQYILQWKGKGIENARDIDVALESAIRELSKFYSKNGPTASLPLETKNAIYAFLDQAEKLL